MPDSGDKAPNFNLKNLEGINVSLEDLQGSAVVINFWQTSCPYCIAEFPYLEQIYEKYKNAGLGVYAVNIAQTEGAVRTFLENNPVHLPILLDTNRGTATTYGVGGIPVTFFIDRNGIIKSKRIGAFTSITEVEVYLEDILP